MSQRLFVFISTVSVLFIPACVAEQNRAGGSPKPINSAAIGSIEILRDHWEIPHIFSESDAGAMYGLGYVTAQDGTTKKNDWQGIVPHDLMPHVLNPESGVLFSANHPSNRFILSRAYR